MGLCRNCFALTPFPKSIIRSRLVGPITYTEQEKAFADKIMKEYGSESQGIAGGIKPLETTKSDPEGGSTDVGDVSYIVPEITLNAATAPYKSPWHS